jgi:hypothetical protein
MSERMLIAKIRRNEAGRIELFARGHQYRDTLLFDDSDLLTVDINPNTIENGQVLAVRFWALYELSEKLNQRGNPYKNVIALERVDKPATTTSVDSSATVAELRAIRELLQYIATLLEGQDLQPPDPLAPSSQPPDPAPPTDPDLLDQPLASNDHFADVHVTDTPPPQAADPDLDQHAARTQFYALNGEAFKLGMESQQINGLIDLANKQGFAVALVELENLLERLKRDTALPVEPATRGHHKLYKS